MPLRSTVITALARTGLAASLLFALCVAGCSSAGSEAEGSGGMGMGGSGPTPGPGMGLGVVAPRGSSELEAPEENRSAKGVMVDRVLAPSPGWLVVRSLSSPGGVLGRVRVPEGVSRDVVVPLDAADASRVRVALHVDRGQSSVFEYDPNRPERSFDKPIFVDGDPIEADVDLELYGVEAPQNLGAMLVKDQKLGEGGTLLVEYVRLPGPSWVAVHIMEDGVPGRLLGWVPRGKGESFSFPVPLTGAHPGDELMVTLHIDRGVIGEFEYDVSSPLNAVDQPFTANGLIVAQNVTLQ